MACKRSNIKDMGQVKQGLIMRAETDFILSKIRTAGAFEQSGHSLLLQFMLTLAAVLE